MTNTESGPEATIKARYIVAVSYRKLAYVTDWADTHVPTHSSASDEEIRKAAFQNLPSGRLTILCVNGETFSVGTDFVQEMRIELQR